MGEALAYLPAILAVAVAWYELRLPRGSRSAPGVWQLCSFGLCMGLALAVLAPTTGDAVEQVWPALRPGVYLLGRELEMAALYFLVSAVIRMDLSDGSPRAGGDRLARCHMRITVVSTALCAVLFLVSGAEGVDGTVTAEGTGRVLVAVFDTVFTLYSVWCLCVFIPPVHGHTRGLRPGPLRTGLRLIVASAAVGVLWAVWGVTSITDMLRTGSQRGGQGTVSVALAAGCLVLGVLGATAAKWGAAPARWIRAYRDYRALQPLWTELNRVVPGTALTGGWTRASPIGIRDAEFALYRRVIEIRDGYLALRPYMHPETPDWAATAVGRYPAGSAGVEATVEAATIAAALESARAGIRCGTEDAAGQTTHSVRGTVDAEAAWLIRVSEALTLSTAVAYVRSRARGELERVGERSRVADGSAPER